MLSKIKSFVTEFRWWRISGGLLKAVLSMVHRIVSWLFTYWDRFILAGPLPGLSEAVPITEGITVREGTVHDLPALSRLAAPSDLKQFAQRFEAGRLCGVALEGDEVVAHVWAGFETRLDMDRVNFQLLPGEVHLFHAYTAPSYRRRGIMTSMISLIALLRARGARRVVVTVDKRNYPSLVLCQKRLGLHPVGYSRYVRLFGRKFCWSQRDDLPLSASGSSISDVAPKVSSNR